MTPLPKSSGNKRTELSLGTVVAVASICSAIVSATVAWTVVHFSVRDANRPAASIATETSQLHIPAPPTQNVHEPTISEVADSGPLQPAINISEVSRTAGRTLTMAMALLSQFGTNPYFKNRDTIKENLTMVSTRARILLIDTQRGDDPATIATSVRNLDASLGKTIDRLDYLLQSQSEKDINDAEVSRALKAKLEEIRASLPQP
jgi:hypothetical protein